ncbi:MAG: fatty acid hydroxylase [Frankiales bacterium]|nr:fatty acid hydroxylase [Frankiales bacterium]
MPAVIRQTRNLDDSFHEFLRHPAPLLLMGQLAVLAVARGLVGDWAWTDLIIAAAVVAAQPFTEWVLHVTVLHCPADGRLRDKIAGYSHRRHHEEPRDLRYQFIHPNIVYGGWVVDLVILAIFRNHGALTGVLVATILALNYEWIHFLIHTDYQPKHELYRRLHRAHRLHHFRNEQYWLGVTARTGDRLLGTNPRKEDVEISPTAKTALAARS